MGVFKFADEQQSQSKNNGPVIKVFGIGGGGGNAVEHMVQSHLYGVEFICANTDMQALSSMSSPTLVQLGAELTRGLGGYGIYYRRYGWWYRDRCCSCNC